MKKFISFLTIFALVCTLGGCSQPTSNTDDLVNNGNEPTTVDDVQPNEDDNQEDDVQPNEDDDQKDDAQDDSSNQDQPDELDENQTSTGNDVTIENPTPEPEDDIDALVVYFSWSNNTEAVAVEIQNQTSADTYELIPAQPYTEDYDELLDIASDEQRNNARPEISGSVDLTEYEVIYLGYPIWWSDMPMLLYTFLDTYDLSGKVIAPFCTSGGSGLARSIQGIQNAEPNAEVVTGLHIGSSNASNSSAAVSDWLSQLSLSE